MRFLTIRDNYLTFLTTLNEAGVKIDASQKAKLDKFILAIESTMSLQRRKAILMAKKATERELEKKYGELFESIIRNTHNNFELATKILDKLTTVEESAKIADKVDNYLQTYVESVCPDKVIVDYAKMKKLEALNESLREVLLVNDEDVEKKKQQLEESFQMEKSKLETRVAKMQVKLNESMEQTQELNKKIKRYKASLLLEAKTQDLPAFEARMMKKKFALASAPEIEKNFDKVLESIKKKSADDEAKADLALEDEVNNIVSEGDNLDEDDILNNRLHNFHHDKPSDKRIQEKEEEFESTETVQMDEDGNILLDEDDIINESTMLSWMQRYS